MRPRGSTGVSLKKTSGSTLNGFDLTVLRKRTFIH